MKKFSAAKTLISSVVAFGRPVAGAARWMGTRSDFPDAETYKPKRYKLSPFYDPYGPRPPPSDRILRLADRIAALSPEELDQFGPCLRDRIRAPRLQIISDSDAPAAGAGIGGGAAAAVEEKKAEKTAFDVKLEKFDAAAKIKVIKEVRAFTNLGLKEAKELVEKAPVVLKQGISKEEANDIIEKIKNAGGVAVME